MVIAFLAPLALLPPNVSAQQSRLEQEIMAPDCSQPEDCTLKSPSIFMASKNGGRPVFTGAFDAAFTKTLRVIFGGKVYRLGIDSELTVRNNEWRFDLSRLIPSLEPGGYTFLIEAVGYDGTIKQASTTIILLLSDIEQSPGGPTPGEDGGEQPQEGEETPPAVDEDATPRPDVPYETIHDIRNICVIVALLVLAIGLMLLYWVARRRSDSRQ